MERVYKYSVLMCVPNRRRGERVNVGIVVFRENDIDFHVPEVSKIKFITGKNWGIYSSRVLENLKDRFLRDKENIFGEIEGDPQIDPAFDLSRFGMFVSSDEREYSTMVKEILDNLVITPKPVVRRRSAKRINTEIAAALKQRGMLAVQDEAVESHKVFRDQDIEDGLSADFVQKNGVWRCAATLDLRSPPNHVKEASLKAITLDRAKAKFGDDTICVGVYAANDLGDPNVKRQLHLMDSYSTSMFNWQDPKQKNQLVDFYGQALRAGSGFL